MSLVCTKRIFRRGDTLAVMLPSLWIEAGLDRDTKYSVSLDAHVGDSIELGHHVEFDARPSIGGRSSSGTLHYYIHIPNELCGEGENRFREKMLVNITLDEL